MGARYRRDPEKTDSGSIALNMVDLRSASPTSRRSACTASAGISCHARIVADEFVGAGADLLLLEVVIADLRQGSWPRRSRRWWRGVSVFDADSRAAGVGAIEGADA